MFWKQYMLYGVFDRQLERLLPAGGGGGSVRPASQNPYSINDQSLRYSLPYLWPDQKSETLFMTWLLNQNVVSDQRQTIISLVQTNVKLPQT